MFTVFYFAFENPRTPVFLVRRFFRATLSATLILLWGLYPTVLYQKKTKTKLNSTFRVFRELDLRMWVMAFCFIFCFKPVSTYQKNKHALSSFCYVICPSFARKPEQQIFINLTEVYVEEFKSHWTFHENGADPEDVDKMPELEGEGMGWVGSGREIAKAHCIIF